MSRTVLFDVNETLLDLGALDDAFAGAFGEAAARTAWFESVLHTALRITATDAYVPFDEIAAAALDDLATRRERNLAPEDRDAILGGVKRLPAHPDAAPALEQLREAGFRLAALTNSAREGARRKLDHAGLTRFLDAVLSADESERLKPAPAPYRMAARRLGVDLEETWFVAAHDWDIAGARHAGYRTAFVAREGKRLGPLVEPPDLTGPDLEAVADQIVQAVRAA